MAEIMMEQRAARKKVGKNKRKPELEKIIADSDREILHWKNTKLSLYEQYKAGSISREGYIAKIEKGKIRLEELERIKDDALEELENMQSIQNQSEVCDADLKDFSELDSFNMDKLKLLIDKVIVYGEDEIEIVWRVDDPF